MHDGDTPGWRAHVLSEYGLDNNAVEAWFRTGYSPEGIDEYYDNLKQGIVPKYIADIENVAVKTDQQRMDDVARKPCKTVSPPVKPFVFEIGGRHFSRKDDRLLMNVGSTLGIEVWNAMASDDVGLVELHVNLDGKSFIVRGSTQRHPDDTPDPEVAISLATLRALQSLVRRLERQVDGRVRHNDWVAAQRPAVAEARRQRAEVKEAIPRNDWDMLCEAIRAAGFDLVPLKAAS